MSNPGGRIPDVHLVPVRGVLRRPRAVWGRLLAGLAWELPGHGVDLREV